MADARVVRPRGGAWQLTAEEDALRADLKGLPNWRLANAARKMLAALLHQLTDEMPSVGERRSAEIDPVLGRQVAGAQLGGIALRSASAAMTLVSTGYEPESGAFVRRLIESVLRARAVLEDASGEHARQWLDGRPPGSAERLAQRFGESEDLALLSRVVHADARALQPVAIPPGWMETHPDDGFFSVRPDRHPGRCGFVLYAIAYELGRFSGVLAELFGVAVQMPRWLHTELLAARDRLPHANDAS